MIEPVGQVWLDGSVVPADDSRIGLLTHSLHYGYAALDGFRSYAQDGGGVAVFRPGDHLDRLLRSAAALGFEVGTDREALLSGALDVLRANQLSDAYVRAFAWSGEPNIIFAHWLNPVHVALVPFPWSGYSDRDADKGTPAVIAEYRRTRGHAPLFRAKLSGHYMLNVIAYGQARAAGVAQAIFLDEQGTVCEATGENVFALLDGVLVTPRADGRPLLPGITRDTVLALAADLGIPTAERDLTVEDLHGAAEIITTGTASGLLHVPELAGRPVGAGDNPVTRALRERHAAAVRGRLADRADWLVPL